MNRFNDCLPFILKEEGGYSDNPSDHGGATDCGVTQHVYDAYRTRLGLSIQAVSLISQAEIADIYRTEYWHAVSADFLAEPIDMVVFDSAVNCGVSEAAKWLQRAVNVADDGVIGPKTIAAISWAGTPQVIANNILDQREKFYQNYAERNPSQEKFLNGWENRVNALKKIVTS